MVYITRLPLGIPPRQCCYQGGGLGGVPKLMRCSCPLQQRNRCNQHAWWALRLHRYTNDTKTPSVPRTCVHGSVWGLGRLLGLGSALLQLAPHQQRASAAWCIRPAKPRGPCLIIECSCVKWNAPVSCSSASCRRDMGCEKRSDCFIPAVG